MRVTVDTRGVQMDATAVVYGANTPEVAEGMLRIALREAKITPALRRKED